MNESFTVERTDIKSLLSNYNLSIPPFQRKFVWNDDKKRDLIESLNRSFPIGAITLFLNKEENCYLIVDGLQRINTIKAYLHNPCGIAPFKYYFEKIKDDLYQFATKYNLSASKIKKGAKQWYESLDTASDSTIFKFKDFSHLQRCISDKSLSIISNDLGIFQEFRSILLQPIDIEGENIGLITYKGMLDDLPELFSKINQKNISLTGYEILHSLWYKYTIPKDYTGFQQYLNAFKTLANKSEGYVRLDDNYFESFNMYMNLSSLEEIIENKIDGSIRKALTSRNGFQIFKSETIFDIFSTICLKTTNKINKSVEYIFSDVNSATYDFILELNNAIVETSIFLNEYLYEHCVEVYSKYFYIYFFYYIFIKKFSFDLENKTCTKKINAEFDDKQMLESIEEATNKRWFKDENRQLAFFVDKIRNLN